jgi:hypothetical protein
MEVWRPCLQRVQGRALAFLPSGTHPTPSEDELAVARFQGKRVAMIAKAVRG